MWSQICLVVAICIYSVRGDGCTRSCTLPLVLYETTCVCLRPYVKASCERGDDDSAACQRIIDAGLCGTQSYRASCATGCGLCDQNDVPLSNPQVFLRLPKNSVEALYAVDCGPAPEIVNGVATSSSTLFTSIARYSCNPGYNLVGPGVKKCMKDAQWSSHASTCEADQCFGVTCQNGGTCNVNGESYTCACEEGYNGDHCEEDPCFGVTCQNGGTCNVNGESYTCACEEGYNGDQCEEDPCFGVTCQNGGTCNVNGESYTCACEEGYNGDQCEEDPCFGVTCQNGGTCNVNGESYTCACEEGYNGDQCEEDPCFGVACPSGKSCSIDGPGFICTCDRVGFTGTNCETRVIDCFGWYMTDNSLPNGVYQIQPDDGLGPISVYCDMENEVNGIRGLTVFHYRFNGIQDFNQTWNSYTNGFGDLENEFWLGLANLHRLTQDAAYICVIEMEERDGETGYAWYPGFSIGSETDKFRLHLGNENERSFGGVLRTRGDRDALDYHDGMRFTTFDQDNDILDSGNCAVVWRGAFWHRRCHLVNLNGLYHTNAYGIGITWQDWALHLTYTRMSLFPIYGLSQ